MARKSPTPNHPAYEKIAPEKLKFPMSKAELTQLYRHLILTRFYEDKLPILYRQGKLFGGVYRGTGHEAISVGTASALAPDDIIAPLHRAAGAHLVRGQSLRRMYGNYMGRACGPSRGRDGNIHHGDMGKNIIGMISHLGSSIPLSVGAALGSRMLGKKVVSMTYIGDGGTSIGDFHEGLNFAAVHDAPFVLVIENNQYAYSTPNRLQFRCKQLVDRALGYGIKGKRVFGADVVTVYQAAREAVEHARDGKGPVLLECVTMRVHGHSEHDSHEYVPPELLEYWAQYDPIELNRRYLLEFKVLSKKEMAAIDEEVKEEVDDAAEWAEKQPFPEGASITDGIWCEERADG